MRVRVKRSESAAPPTSMRHADAGIFQIGGGDNHLLGALDQQAGEPDGVGRVFLEGANQGIGGHLDAEVDDAVAVVAEDDFDQVFADVVDVAFDGGEDDFAAGGGVGLLHELFEMGDGGLHGFGRLQTSATISSLLLKRRPTSAMPVMSGPLMISSGAAPSARLRSRSGMRPSLVPSMM